MQDFSHQPYHSRCASFALKIWWTSESFPAWCEDEDAGIKKKLSQKSENATQNFRHFPAWISADWTWFKDRRQMCLDTIQIERSRKEPEHMNFQRKSFCCKRLAHFDVGIGSIFPMLFGPFKAILHHVQILNYTGCWIAHASSPVSKAINTWIEDDWSIKFCMAQSWCIVTYFRVQKIPFVQET